MQFAAEYPTQPDLNRLTWANSADQIKVYVCYSASGFRYKTDFFSISIIRLNIVMSDSVPKVSVYIVL